MNPEGKLYFYKCFPSDEQRALYRQSGFQLSYIPWDSAQTRVTPNCACIAFFKLSDGHIFVTDTMLDFYENEYPRWARGIQRNDITAYRLSTTTCGPLSSHQLKAILHLVETIVDPRDPNHFQCRIPSKLSAEVAVSFQSEFRSMLDATDPNEVDDITVRAVIHDASYEGLEITHFKVNGSSIFPVFQRNDLNLIDASRNNVFLMYTTASGVDTTSNFDAEYVFLQKGDTVNADYVCRTPEWTS